MSKHFRKTFNSFAALCKLCFPLRNCGCCGALLNGKGRHFLLRRLSDDSAHTNKCFTQTMLNMNSSACQTELASSSVAWRGAGTTCTPPPVSDDLNSHPDLSVLESLHMSTVQVSNVPFCVLCNIWGHRTCRWCGLSYTIRIVQS